MTQFFLPGCACLALAVACATGNTQKLALRPELIGAYRFTERVSSDVEISGVFAVEQDSISIEANPGPCRYERERSNALGVIYQCADVTYTFDRTDPVHKATYSTMVRLAETRTVCVRYVVNSAGRSVCAESRKETVYRDVRRSGLLRPMRVSEDTPSPGAH